MNLKFPMFVSFAVALLVVLATSTFAQEGAQAWTWQEGEFPSAQRGSTGDDFKAAASGGSCLGMNWGGGAEGFAEYALAIPADFSGAALYLRYARVADTPAVFDVKVDGRMVGRSPSLTLEPTGGWGDDSSDWRIARVRIGRLAAGKHTIRLESKADDNNANIDGFYIAASGATPPGVADPQYFERIQRQREEKEMQAVRELVPEVKSLELAPQERPAPKPGPVDLAVLLAKLRTEQLDYVLEWTAKKPIPYIVKSYDVGHPTDYNSDYVWHSLKKEKMFDLPYKGRVGLVNPNSDVNYFIGFKVGTGEPVFDLESETKIHLIDLLVESVELEGIKADVCFVPAKGDTLLTVVILQNPGEAEKELSVYQVCAKEPVELEPKQRYGHGVTVTAGKLAWMGYDPANDVMVNCFTEWQPKPRRPVGRLLCTMAGSENSAGRLPADMPAAPPEASQMEYRIALEPQETKALLLVLNMHRYGEQPIKSPRGMLMYPVETEHDALEAGLKSALEAIALDWRGQIRQSVARYRRMPVIKLPHESWISDYYAALELPWGEAFSPQKNLDVPFYNFCRVNAHEPYGWWSYGEHGHEHLATFVCNITNPRLSADFLRGHFRNQSEDGGFPYGVTWTTTPQKETGRATCPFVAWEAWTSYLWSGDKKFLREAYKACGKNHDFWRTKRDRTGKGLYHWLDYAETVRDDADLPTWTATGGAENQEALDLNCYLLVEERCLAEMARELGRVLDVADWETWAVRRAIWINDRLWHDEDECYYGKDTEKKEWARVKDISTFFPWWAKVASETRAEALLTYFDDPKKFATDYPLPTLALDEPEFGAKWHWHGSNWVEMSWLPILGLKNYGWYDRAAKLAYQNTKMVFDVLEKESHFREYYNSVDGSGVGLFDYIWSCMPGAMVTQVFFGIEPTREGLLVMPALPQGWTEISIDNVHVRGKNVGVTVRLDEAAEEAAVTLNGKTLEPRDGRGAFVRWKKLPKRASFQIIVPGAWKERGAGEESEG